MDKYKVFQGTFFSLHYPSQWEHEIIENIPAFFDPKGSGVLQVASSTVEDSLHFNLKIEMIKYLDRNKLAYHEDKITFFKSKQGIDIAFYEFIKEGRFWIVSMITVKNKLLIILYNSDEYPNRDLTKTIFDIIMSIEIH